MFVWHLNKDRNEFAKVLRKALGFEISSTRKVLIDLFSINIVKIIAPPETYKRTPDVVDVLK